MNDQTMRLNPIGTIRTPYSTLEDCPRNIGLSNESCQIIVERQYVEGLEGLNCGQKIQILYWLDRSVFTDPIQTSRKSGEKKGVFALRTPNRPNPIGSADVIIDDIFENTLTVHGLDCLDGTPLLDIKPAFKG